MGLDRLALVVDPAVRPRFLNHTGEILLPPGVAVDAWPLAQSILEDPGGLWVRQFGFARDRLAHRAKAVRSALDHELESAKVAAVFEQ
jgi:hypothetical protein